MKSKTLFVILGFLFFVSFILTIFFVNNRDNNSSQLDISNKVDTYENTEDFLENSQYLTKNSETENNICRQIKEDSSILEPYTPKGCYVDTDFYYIANDNEIYYYVLSSDTDSIISVLKVEYTNNTITVTNESLDAVAD